MMVSLYSLSSLVALFVLVFIFYDRYRVDKLRQDLFALRDRLFDEATRGKVEFDSPSYRYTRSVLNGLIRFAHRLSISRILTAAILSDDEDRDFVSRRIEEMHQGSSAQSREFCDKFLKDANLLVVKHVGSSPFFVLCALPLISLFLAFVFGLNLTSVVLEHCAALLRKLDQIAYEEATGSQVKPRSLSSTFAANG